MLPTKRIPDSAAGVPVASLAEAIRRWHDAHPDPAAPADPAPSHSEAGSAGLTTAGAAAPLQRCARCHHWLPESAFYLTQPSWCRACVRAYASARRLRVRDERRRAATQAPPTKPSRWTLGPEFPERRRSA